MRIPAMGTIGTKGVRNGRRRCGSSRRSTITENATAMNTISVPIDRKSTRLNSSHQIISYAVFCLKKKKNTSHVADHANRYHAFTPLHTEQTDPPNTAQLDALTYFFAYLTASHIDTHAHDRHAHAT